MTTDGLVTVVSTTLYILESNKKPEHRALTVAAGPVD